MAKTENEKLTKIYESVVKTLIQMEKQLASRNLIIKSRTEEWRCSEKGIAYINATNELFYKIDSLWCVSHRLFTIIKES